MKQLAVFVCVLAVTLSLTGCPSNTYHQVNRLNKQASDDLNAFVAVVINLHGQGEVNDAEEKELLGAASKVLEAKGVLNQQLRSVNTIDTSNRAQVLGYVQTFVDAMQPVAASLGHIKNSHSQQILSQAFALVTTALQTAIALLPPSGPAPAPIKAAAGWSLALPSILAAFAALAKLVAQYRADGTLTDLQIQDAIDAEDETTKKQIAAALAALAPPPAAPSKKH